MRSLPQFVVLFTLRKSGSVGGSLKDALKDKAFGVREDARLLLEQLGKQV